MKLLGQRIEVSQADEIKMMQHVAARSAARRCPDRTRITCTARR